MHKSLKFWLFFLLMFLITFLLISKSNSESLRNSRWDTWIDEDKDGQNTREEFLILHSLEPIKLNKEGDVILGLWRCPYTGFLSINPRNS